MDKEKLIESAVAKMKKLPEDKVKEVEDFLDFLIAKYLDDAIIQKGIDTLINDSKTYDFLKEEDIYTINDLKEKYK